MDAKRSTDSCTAIYMLFRLHQQLIAVLQSEQNLKLDVCPSNLEAFINWNLLNSYSLLYYYIDCLLTNSKFAFIQQKACLLWVLYSSFCCVLFSPLYCIVCLSSSPVYLSAGLFLFACHWSNISAVCRTHRP